MRNMEEQGRRVPVRVERPRRRLLASCRIKDPATQQATLHSLYDRFTEARQRSGDARRKLTFDAFMRGIALQADKLQKSSGCGEIELLLVVDDEKVQLKARPGR